ncbi:LuxR C-terminal-related transcriptional regulator [Streptomyces leeuwenhoekii]|uniref:helix-turn-helix transcriptional regulator n=1 Tax=Streptomyces leeuwenhoekii TaxID=1437453 RepID=UPI003701B6CA
MAATRRTADVLSAAVGLRRAAQHAARGTTGTDAVLAALSEVIDHDFASLAQWDPLRRRHLTLAGTYPDTATAYIENRLHDDPAFAAIRRSPDGVRWWRDVPVPERRVSPGIQEVLGPLGVRGGLAQCLFAADGRYVGVLNVSTTRAHREPEALRAVMALLGEALGAVADPLTAPPPPGAPDGGACAVVLPQGREAEPVPVSGRPLPGLASADAPLVRLVRRVAAGRPLPATVLVPYQRRLLELRVTRQGPALHAACRPVARPAALSAREMDVLAELTRGRTNREIADRLCVAVRTVATHVEHILAKLDVPNRAAAAGRAAAWGLEPAP